jgi:hypothetical protein
MIIPSRVIKVEPLIVSAVDGIVAFTIPKSINFGEGEPSRIATSTFDGLMSR